jgi:small subunit ribosomal protein S7
MARRRRAIRRIIPPDRRFASVDISRLINKVMTRGKKTVAQHIVYQALDRAEKDIRRSPLEIVEQALRNVTPSVQVKPRRVGGATYQVPVEIGEARRQSLAYRWLVNAARARTGRPMAERLALELADAFKGQGAAVKRREDLHRMAEANRAFVHYRW